MVRILISISLIQSPARTVRLPATSHHVLCKRDVKRLLWSTLHKHCGSSSRDLGRARELERERAAPPRKRARARARSSRREFCAERYG